MVRSPLRLGSLVLVAVALGLAGCGGDDNGDEASRVPPTPAPEDFPSPGSKTMAQLKQELGPGPVLAPAVAVLEPKKENRFGFGLFDRARKQIADAPAAIYVAPVGGGPVRGPYPARFESLKTDPEFRSQSVAEDPDAGESVYVADIPFEEPGDYEAIAAVRLDDRLTAATLSGTALRVVKDSPVPEVGEKAIKINTPTVEDVGGAIDSIETRVPPDSMHEVNFADVVGKKPVVLLFSTPALCQVRICGPVNDVTEQVKAKYGDKVAFVHMEIYNDNELEKGFRPQVRAYNLPTEPWAFVVNRRGRIAAEFEGAFSANELDKAVAKVAK
jgi:hypothetical protein